MIFGSSDLPLLTSVCRPLPVSCGIFVGFSAGASDAAEPWPPDQILLQLARSHPSDDWCGTSIGATRSPVASVISRADITLDQISRCVVYKAGCEGTTSRPGLCGTASGPLCSAAVPPRSVIMRWCYRGASNRVHAVRLPIKLPDLSLVDVRRSLSICATRCPAVGASSESLGLFLPAILLGSNGRNSD